MDQATANYVAQLTRQTDEIIADLRAKIDGLERGYAVGIVPTLNAFKQSNEMVAEAIRRQAEQQQQWTKLLTNAGAVYSAQVPGAREPRWQRVDLVIPAGSTDKVVSTPAQFLAAGPIEIAQIGAIAVQNIPVFGSAGGVITRQLRFRAINSAWVEPGATPDPAAVAQPGYSPDLSYNGIMDFFWSYQSASSGRYRMNAPIPSSWLFGQDRPAYLACPDLFRATDAVTVEVTPLFPTFAWPAGVPGAGQVSTPADTAQPVTIIFVLHGTLLSQAPAAGPAG